MLTQASGSKLWLTPEEHWDKTSIDIVQCSVYRIKLSDKNKLLQPESCTRWNNLPNSVKQETTVNMFKNRFDEYMKQGVFIPN